MEFRITKGEYKEMQEMQQKRSKASIARMFQAERKTMAILRRKINEEFMKLYLADK